MKWFASFALLFMLLPRAHGADGKFVPVCERSRAVRNAISGAFASNCEKITANMLSMQSRLEIVNEPDVTLVAGDLSGFTHIQELLISQVDKVTIGEGVFHDVPSLTGLYFVRANLPTLRADMFKGLDSLTVLVFDRGVQEIEVGAFNGLQSLIRLELKFLDIQKIPRGLFVDMPQIKDLAIEACEKLTEIEDTAFAELSSLETLSLAGAPLTNTGKAALKGAPARVHGLPPKFDLDGEMWGGN